MKIRSVALRHWLGLGLLLVVGAATAARPTEFVDVRGKALSGDYQAQRNLAFGYSNHPYAGQVKNALLACAWRMVIARSGNERVDQTDMNNLQVDCSSLNAQERASATEQARELHRQIYKRQPGF